MMNGIQMDRSDAQRAVRRINVRGCRPAFTLIELLVVVSIIALLLSILLPSLRNAREQAKLIKCLAHMRGVGQAAMSFAVDHDGRVQLAASSWNTAAADPGRQRFAYGSGGELLAWPVALAQVLTKGCRNNWDWGVRATLYSEAESRLKYVNADLDFLTCPSDPVLLSSSYFPRHEGLVGSGDPRIPVNPAQGMAYWGRLSYGVNEDVAGSDGADDVDRWPSCWRVVRANDGGWKECRGGEFYGPSSECFSGPGARLRGELGKIHGPSQVGLFFEAGPESRDQANSGMFANQYAALINSTEQVQGWNGPYLGNSQQSHPWRIPTNRHTKGRLNVTFADGHGETVRAVEYALNLAVNRVLPCKYAPRVRVSPYNPHGQGE
jgi:prepilin-type N-terminal cleavage/methylation domain-containing protein/prepilin-type processing-associated H-X9-DG protein